MRKDTIKSQSIKLHHVYVYHLQTSTIPIFLNWVFNFSDLYNTNTNTNLYKNPPFYSKPMSTATNHLTHFPILSFPPKSGSFPNPLSLSSSSSSSSLNRRCSSAKLVLSHSGKFLICRKLGLMGERVINVSSLRSGDGEEEKKVRVLEQEPLVNGSSQFRLNFSFAEFETTLNRLSKWLVAALFAVVILCRHDAEALWAAMGSIINSGLSVFLKRILNQERPVSNLRSDPGMPSSHAQSIFYTLMFVITSMVEWQGFNERSLVFGIASLAFGSYLTWLRVSQQLHTVSQVVVGAVLGSSFLLLWLWSWDAFVLDAFNSSMWVQLSVLLISAILGLTFLSYVIRNWLSDDRDR